MPKHLRAKEPKLFAQFERWAEMNPEKYDKLMERAHAPGIWGKELIERTYNLWKIERGVN